MDDYNEIAVLQLPYRPPVLENALYSAHEQEWDT